MNQQLTKDKTMATKAQLNEKSISSVKSQLILDGSQAALIKLDIIHL